MLRFSNSSTELSNHRGIRIPLLFTPHPNCLEMDRWFETAAANRYRLAAHADNEGLPGFVLEKVATLVVFSCCLKS
jgi:hypothetical protein